MKNCELILVGFHYWAWSCALLWPNQTAQELLGSGEHMGFPDTNPAPLHPSTTCRQKNSSCYRYNNTGWITPDFILLHNTAAATEIRGVINFPAAIYVNTLIPLQIVVLPNQAKQKQLKSQRSLGCQWQQVWFCWEQQSYSICTAIFYWWAVLTSVQLLQQMNKLFWIYFHIQCDPFKTSV